MGAKTLKVVHVIFVEAMFEFTLCTINHNHHRISQQYITINHSKIKPTHHGWSRLVVSAGERREETGEVDRERNSGREDDEEGEWRWWETREDESGPLNNAPPPATAAASIVMIALHLGGFFRFFPKGLIFPQIYISLIFFRLFLFLAPSCFFLFIYLINLTYIRGFTWTGGFPPKLQIIIFIRVYNHIKHAFRFFLFLKNKPICEVHVVSFIHSFYAILVQSFSM